MKIEEVGAEEMSLLSWLFSDSGKRVKYEKKRTNSKYNKTLKEMPESTKGESVEYVVFEPKKEVGEVQKPYEKIQIPKYHTATASYGIDGSSSCSSYSTTCADYNYADLFASSRRKR